jgi:glycosyltransferase involved in cell wall biosynthesis
VFTVVIPFWNGHQYLDKLLSTIPESIPVLIIDDISDSPVPAITRPNTQIKRLAQKGYFTGAVNEGIKACSTDMLILNQDTYFNGDGWLNFIEEQKQQYGIFGEAAGAHPAWPHRYVHGTFMYIQRDVIRAVGTMDAENYPLWGSTCEYQLRACRKGFKANPVEVVPGFVHKRRGPYGSAIQQALATGKQGKLIRTPPLISVVITCFNHGKYLADAINSLIGGKTSLGDMPGQAFQAFEIVIVDDGSTDNSAKVAARLADPWQGIHFIHQKNKGSAAAMNTGIQASHARSDHLIAVLDGDDMMEPSRLQRMLKTYENNSHSVVYDNIQYFGNGQRGVVTDWESGKSIHRLNLKGYNFEQMLSKNAMHKGLLYPKRAWEETGGYPEIMNQGREDWAFNIALGVKGWCGVSTGEYDYLYRREGQNRTLRNTSPGHHAKFLEQLKSIFPAIYAGERPDMCCGRPSATASKNGGIGVAAMSTKRTKDLPGQQGMVILEYQGRNAGDETWTGEVTGTTYVLGGVRKQGYVDRRDAYGDPARRKEGLLNKTRDGRKVFVEIKPEPIAQPVKLAEAKLKEAVILQGQELRELQPGGQIVSWSGVPADDRWPDVPAEMPDWEIEKGESFLDPSGLSVSALKRELPNLSLNQLEAVLKAERSGPNRFTAKAAIEAAIDERLA